MAIPLHFQLCSTHLTVLQTKNCMRSMNPVTTKNTDDSCTPITDLKVITLLTQHYKQRPVLEANLPITTENMDNSYLQTGSHALQIDT